MFAIDQTKPDQRPKNLDGGIFLGVITGLRYYTPRLGRWVSRDPLGERGGANLFIFLSNKSTCSVDLLGLADVCCSCGAGPIDCAALKAYIHRLFQRYEATLDYLKMIGEAISEVANYANVHRMALVGFGAVNALDAGAEIGSAVAGVSAAGGVSGVSAGASALAGSPVANSAVATVIAKDELAKICASELSGEIGKHGVLLVATAGMPGPLSPLAGASKLDLYRDALDHGEGTLGELQKVFDALNAELGVYREGINNAINVSAKCCKPSATGSP